MAYNPDWIHMTHYIDFPLYVINELTDYDIYQQKMSIPLNNVLHFNVQMVM